MNYAGLGLYTELEDVFTFDTWRILTHTNTNPYENMALDETLLLACNKGLSPPTLRFYTWAPPAVSIGYIQNPRREIELCKKLGIPFVRRMTGGRTMLHYHRDLTYALVLRGEGSLKRISVLNSYKMINMCLVSALREMGIKAEIRLKKVVSSKGKSSLCFLTPANNDIIISGIKIVGSAQRRLDRAFIQHGSILLSSPMSELVKVSNGLEGIDTLDLQESIRKSFENGMGIRFLKDGLTEYEVKLKYRLLKEKYLKDEWNLHKRINDKCQSSKFK